MLKMYFIFYSEVKKTTCCLCDILSHLFLVYGIFIVDFSRHYAMTGVVEPHVANYKNSDYLLK